VARACGSRGQLSNVTGDLAARRRLLRADAVLPPRTARSRGGAGAIAEAFRATPHYRFQAESLSSIASFQAPQPGTSQTIEIDGSNSVWRNGYLYIVSVAGGKSASADAGIPTTYWLKVDTFNWTIVDSGFVSGSALFGSGVATYDPTIAVDAAGDVAINFTASGPSLYAGSYYVEHRSTDPAGTVEMPQPLHVGLDTYVYLYGTRNRWGDYERTIAADPTDANRHPVADGEVFIWEMNGVSISPADATKSNPVTNFDHL